MIRKIVFLLVVGSTKALLYLTIPYFRIRRRRLSVLHISHHVHTAFYFVKILRDHGLSADYLALGSPKNDFFQADLYFQPSSGNSIKGRIRETQMVLKVATRYDILHSHFILTLSKSGWEIPLWKKMGKKWVVHSRGCTSRDRNINIRLHPQMNICQDCDYDNVCMNPLLVARRKLMHKYADLNLVTTPDLKDFVDGLHVKFFTPPIQESELNFDKKVENKPLKILHITNHPGIEGTEKIKEIIEDMVSEGFEIEFDWFSGISNDKVLELYPKYDLSIGKMKMGYYANAQIESLYFGVPAITYIRPEFITEEILHSGLILSSLDTLSEDLKNLYKNREVISHKSQIARETITRIHNNDEISKTYESAYLDLLGLNN